MGLKCTLYSSFVEQELKKFLGTRPQSWRPPDLTLTCRAMKAERGKPWAKTVPRDGGAEIQGAALALARAESRLS